MIGATLGSYQVTAKLGEGGMGAVYRAHDVKLNRDVALKVLPDSVVADADRLARFRREAQVLASLNHPNIAQIYGVEGHALVLELVEGQTIDQMPPILMREALAIARQVALALEAAHERGVIHRDLKPSNIKVRPDGTAKVLDFGLAKALSDGPEGDGGRAAGATEPPTLTARATELGMILGTAAYMAPEQARGKVVDRRADVWAFGVVLFEMVTGRRLFSGSEVTDVLASVIKDAVPFDSLPSETPPAIRRLLRRCLEKDRAERLDSMATARMEIADAMAELDGRAAPDGRSIAASVPLRKTQSSRLVLAATAIAALATGIAAGWAWFGQSTNAGAGAGESGGSVRFAVTLPPGAESSYVALSNADGALVYQSDRLYVRSLSDSEPRPIPGTIGARHLFISPNGRFVGFHQGETLKKVALAGGDPLNIVEAPGDMPGAAWGPNDTILFSPGWNTNIWSVSADGGGTAAPLTTVNTSAGELGHWWPDFLPDGKTALFTVYMAASGINDSKIAALDLTTGKHRVLMPGSYPKYLPSGRLLYYHAGKYQLVPFDAGALRSTGEPQTVLPDARPLDPLGSSAKHVVVSRDGMVAYLSGPLFPERELAWLTPPAAMQTIDVPARSYRTVTLSPDGRRLAFDVTEAGMSTIELLDLVRRTPERLAAAGSNFLPVWSPSGEFMAFTSMRRGHYDVMLARPGEAVMPLIDDMFDQSASAITKDNKHIVYNDWASDASVRLAEVAIERPQEHKVSTIDSKDIWAVQLSADNLWMATVERPAGVFEVVVRPFRRDGASVRVSTKGGTSPMWSRTNSTLYYVRDDELVAVTYSTAGGRFVVERETTIAKPGPIVVAGIGPDGRFLIARERSGQATRIEVVTNWLTAVKPGRE